MRRDHVGVAIKSNRKTGGGRGNQPEGVPRGEAMQLRRIRGRLKDSELTGESNECGFGSGFSVPHTPQAGALTRGHAGSNQDCLVGEPHRGVGSIMRQMRVIGGGGQDIMREQDGLIRSFDVKGIPQLA